ncbi:leukocyte elastase inhibitor-like [Rhinoderma darwinii]|uniref:leukocyte elastase inhibitor-like n=1 Tax=Rhinoderma darwinii TaxID=43563 RepID=UPI003F676FBD
MNAISNSINHFSFDLSNELRSSESDKNTLISPLSISAALALLLLGSRGNTAAQIQKVLHLPESQMPSKDEKRGFGKLCGKKMKKEEVADVHNQFHELLYKLRSSKSDSVLTIANAAFTQLNFPLSKEYLRSAESLYEAKLETVDFQDDKTRQKINSWVEEKTEGKIKDLFPEHSVDRSTSLILVNAVYFKGQWQKKFKEENTRDAPFFMTKESEISVPMMSQSERFNFGLIEAIDAQIIELPYGTGDLCMFIVLPNEVSGLLKIEEQITSESLMKWTNSKNLALTKVDIQVPRFKIEISYNLVQYLTDIGMVDAFSQQKANLSGISEVGLYVSQVIHKCFIDVNEEGTEAAAATGAVIVPKSLLLPRKFTVDHPFLCFIKHMATDTILFHVKVYAP